MKTHEKKKRFRTFCRAQVVAGLINQPNGNWAPAQVTKAMDQMMRAGYRIR